MNTVTILQGHVIDKLRELPENSVHCVITSVPYWGLRDYGTEPQIWDGKKTCTCDYSIKDLKKDMSALTKSLVVCHKCGGCQHEWGDEIITDGRKYNSERDGNGVGQSQESQGRSAIKGQFCKICNAWRGSYGLEPTIELYVQHTVEIFRAVRRVLYPTGVLLLNLGDSYYGGGGAHKESHANPGISKSASSRRGAK